MMKRKQQSHLSKAKTSHVRFDFARHHRRSPKPFFKAIIHGDFWDKHRKRLRSGFFKRYRFQLTDSVVILSTFAFSFWLMFWTFQYHDGQFVMLGRVWSDFAAHIPLIRSFSMGHNFPPEYPTFPGEPIRYHYLFFLIAAGLEKLGFNIAFAFDLPSALGLWLLLVMIYYTSVSLLRSRKAAILAIVLFLFNGTWSIWETIKQSSSIPDLLHKIVAAKEYASFGPWDGHIVSAFWNWNIYLNQRHLAASFGIALALCYPLLRYSQDKTFKLKTYWYPLIYGGFVLFPLFHQAAYIMAVGWCLWWGALYCRKIPKRILFLYFWSFVFSLITQFGLSQNTKQQTAVALGYLTQEGTPFGITKYWLFNLGFYFLLLPIFWVFSKRRSKLFLVPFIGFFVLANVMQLSTDMINNHKLINFFMIAVNILTAGILIRVWKVHWSVKPLVIILVVCLTASGIADVFPVIHNHFLYQQDYPQSKTQQWIMTHTAPNSIFLSNLYIFNPASVVGRKLFLDYGYFNWSMGYKDGERRQLLKQFYSPTIARLELCTLLTDNQINYVHFANTHGKQEYDVQFSTLFTQFTPTYTTESDEYIFKVADNCPVLK